MKLAVNRFESAVKTHLFKSGVLNRNKDIYEFIFHQHGWDEEHYMYLSLYLISRFVFIVQYFLLVSFRI